MHLWGWIAFIALAGTMVAVDLGIGQRRAHRPSMREAALWTALWVGAALLFNAGLYLRSGRREALEFFTGYLIEYSLSVDNLFVFVMIFRFFGVAPDAQPRLLKWGILGAVLMRGLFVALGAAVLHHVHATIYVFGLFLVYTGIKMAVHDSVEVHPDRNLMVRLCRRLFPVAGAYDGARFFTRVDGRRAATPLFVALVAVESTDVLFAVDSIPAIFAITTDPFIVFTSNIFAVLGLRALYFLLAGALDRFGYLKYGISAVLVFVGAKMLAGAFDLDVPIEASLAVVVALLAGSIAPSVLRPPRPAGS